MSNTAVVDQIQVIVFELESKLYGANINQIKEITEIKDITPIPNSANFVEGVTNLRGQVTTVIDLRKRLGLHAKENKNRRMMIMETPKGLVGMIVDSVRGVSMMQRDSIESTPELIQNGHQAEKNYLEGVAKKDGNLILLINLKGLVDGSAA